MDVEKQYVQESYRYLASLPDTNCNRNAFQKLSFRWANVQRFINQLQPGSIVIDIGCGDVKYYNSNCFFMDSDICLDKLMRQQKLPPTVDLQLTDALNLPYRSSSIEAVLLISVLHHFTTLDRRKRALTEIARCLKPRGQALIYVWAFEQPNGKFPSQDVLVPCQIYHCDNFPSKAVKFHMDSTKEERLIRDSISVNFLGENRRQSAYTPLFHRISEVLTSLQILSRDFPSTFCNECTTKNFLSTLIKGKLQYFMQYKAIERFAMEFTERTIEMALTEVLCTKEYYHSYRYYHLFKKDELKVLIAMVPSLRLIHLNYEHANWWAIAEKAN